MLKNQASYLCPLEHRWDNIENCSHYVPVYKEPKPRVTPTAATTAQEEAYRKSLLISRKDKKDMGFEVKLKKQAVLDA